MATTPPPAPVGYGRQREVGFLQDGVPPPSALYMGPGESLEVWVCSLAPATIVRIYARMLSPQGQVIPHRFDLVTGAAGAVLTSRIETGEGCLLSVAVIALSGGIQPGMAFVRCNLVQRGAGAIYPTYTLLSGYVSMYEYLMWPPVHTEHLGSGNGNYLAVAVAAPAAGAEFVVAAPAASIWRLHAIRVQLTTAAAAGNRVVTLRGIIAGVTYWTTGANTAQPPSTVYNYVFATGNPVGPMGSDHYAAPLPAELRLPSAGLISVTAGIQAADQFGAPGLLVSQWVDRP